MPLVTIAISEGVAEEALAWYERNKHKRIAKMSPAERITCSVALVLRARERKKEGGMKL